MPDPNSSGTPTPRVRFAPSPTGFLHVGSARTFTFNWLYARHNHGTMVLRLDDTDTEASVQSIFEGLRWLGLDWDEEYKQSERLALHRKQAEAIFAKGLAYRDFTPAHAADEEHSSSQGAWLSNPGMRELPREDSDRRAASGEPFALRFRVPRGEGRILQFVDGVYGAQQKLADEVEDFALLRSDGMPTYHLASCVDDADLRISHIIRGQDHLTNTFKHLLIFEALGEGVGVAPPHFAHLPLLVAPDGTKLSKRKHGPVVSVTTYRDAGFLPQAFVNFLCLLGWSPKNDREFLSLDEIRDLFTLEGVNRANAVVNFTDDDPFDAKAVWLNAEHIRALPVEELSRDLQPFFEQAGFHVSPEKVAAVTPLIRERIKLLRDAVPAADFFFLDKLAPYDPAELIPLKKGDPKKQDLTGDAALALRVLQTALEVLPATTFDHDSLDKALREAAVSLGLKAGPMFQPIRVAVCGRKNAPPLFETMVVLGREVCLERIREAEKNLQSLA
jgi:glutamyl-tRNA synthetase